MFSRRYDFAALAAVLIVAAVMRFARLDAVEFFHDEAMVSMMAQEMADGETFPLVGILSSVGIPNPPAAVYVMAVPFAVSSDPVFATGYVALLNVVGVGLLWGIARKEFGFVAALVAGLVFAVNPWAVLYSRKIWAQDFVNPFLLLALTAALWGYKDGKRWGQIVALPLMLFAMQIHFAAWALVPLFAWIGWTGRRSIHRGAVLLSVILGVFVMLPYAIGLAQTLQADPTRITDTLERSGVTEKGTFDSVIHALRLATGIDLQTWVAPNVDQREFGGALPLARAAAVQIGALLVISAAVVARGSRLWLVGFALWIMLPVVLFQLALADVWPHYFVPQQPAFALLAGIGFAFLIDYVKRRAGGRMNTAALVSVVLGVVLAAQAFYFSTVMNYAYTHVIEFGEGTSGYTTPMFVLKRVLDTIPPDINDIIVLTDGDRVWFDVEAARWPVMLRDQTHCVRTIPEDRFYVAPEGTSAVIMTPTTSALAANSYFVRQSPLIEARSDEGHYSVTIGIGDISEPAALARFSNGVALVSSAPAPNWVLLRFELPDAPDRTFYGALEHDYQYFIHILDADGNRIGQHDSSFWPGRHWCAGDTLVIRTDIPVPPDALTLRFGFYKLLDAEAGTTHAVDILDEAGNPAGNWVDIPVR